MHLSTVLCPLTRFHPTRPPDVGPQKKAMNAISAATKQTVSDRTRASLGSPPSRPQGISVQPPVRRWVSGPPLEAARPACRSPRAGRTGFETAAARRSHTLPCASAFANRTATWHMLGVPPACQPCQLHRSMQLTDGRFFIFHQAKCIALQLPYCSCMHDHVSHTNVQDTTN